MILLLNGTSSVGKSSIALEILKLAKDPFLIFCMDFFSMTHPRFDAGLPHRLLRFFAFQHPEVILLEFEHSQKV